MSLISFIKDAGEKLFGHKAPAPDAPTVDVDAANKTASDAIAAYIATQNLKVDGLDVAFDGATGTVSVAGEAPDQATREKVVLCCGNVAGVTQVDAMTVAEPADPSRWYTVVRGDTLSAISKSQYGNANDYPKIFEANKPMLTSPDKIYPGQVLRIPA